MRCLSLPGSRSLALGGAPAVMGIVNVTPDSFFGASRALDPVAAAERGLACLAEGAAIVDFGAESTRPGSAPVSPEEELRRLIPAIREFRRRSDAVLSVDTRRAAVARAALGEGAHKGYDGGAHADNGVLGIFALHPPPCRNRPSTPTAPPK